jgi:hypothetical protein
MRNKNIPRINIQRVDDKIVRKKNLQEVEILTAETIDIKTNVFKIDMFIIGSNMGSRNRLFIHSQFFKGRSDN